MPWTSPPSVLSRSSLSKTPWIAGWYVIDSGSDDRGGIVSLGGLSENGLVGVFEGFGVFF
jgi:hypothetical protein